MHTSFPSNAKGMTSGPAPICAVPVCAGIKERCRDRHVLAIQDTTEINYQSHADRVNGLGTVGNGTDKGLFLHPVVVVDAQVGDPAGSRASWVAG